MESIKCKLSPLFPGGLEIPIKVSVQWEGEGAMEILRRKTEEVSFPLRETDQYKDQPKDILNSIVNF